ncbi:MAG: HupE/UreJ family protein [Chitinophagaceae bacterium]|nr:HupE/UreJ family protein [Chitinophagaceae bacterium]
MPNSIIKLFVMDRAIKGEAHIPFLELENALVDNKQRLSDKLFLQSYFLKHIRVRSGDKDWDIKIDTLIFSYSKNEIVGNYKELKISFYLTPKIKDSLRNFTLYYDVVVHQVINHSVIVMLSQDWQNGIHEETKTKELGTIGYDVINSKILPLSINLDSGSKWIGFMSMINMGMQHIKKGTDHLLFLMTLLLPAFLIAENRKWTSYSGIKKGVYKVLLIVSAFTIGHSITLFIAACNLFKLPTQLIEVTIALSIFISAFHCVIPVFYKKEILIALGFGFVHGLAFSQTLQVFQLEKLDLLISILGFNLGIEAMQLIIILMIIPSFILLSPTIFFSVIKNTLAVFVMIIALGWIFQRITNVSNPITELAEIIFEHANWLILIISVLALILYWIDFTIKTKKVFRYRQ